MKKQKRYFLLGQGRTVSYCQFEIEVHPSKVSNHRILCGIDKLRGRADKKYERTAPDFREINGSVSSWGYLTLEDLRRECRIDGLKIIRPKLLKKPSIFQLVAKYKPMVQSLKFLTTKTHLNDLTRIASEQFCKVKIRTLGPKLFEVEFYL